MSLESASIGSEDCKFKDEKKLEKNSTTNIKYKVYLAINK